MVSEFQSSPAGHAAAGKKGDLANIGLKSFPALVLYIASAAYLLVFGNIGQRGEAHYGLLFFVAISGINHLP